MSRPFVKWVGGKTRVLPDLLTHLPKADCLIEPFVGGAAVFLNTDYRRYILADINPDLIRLYQHAKDNTDELIALARVMFKEDNNASAYQDNREIFNSQASGLEKSALFLYLNRHGYNGVCRYNQKGGYNVPYGKHKTAPYFPEEEIRQFAEKANDTKAIFLHSSFQNTVAVMVGTDAVIYCDPPYLPESETANFTQYHTHSFTADHHQQLVNSLLAANRKYGVLVVISNSDTAATREIYRPFKLHEINVQRSVSTDAGNRHKAKEVIGVLKVCPGCDRAGGGSCPDCGPAMGDATYNEMVEGGAFAGGEVL
ncbi:methyl-directed repair DNA adenine methylase [Rahnella aquatilis CIP 78.65 = ATCC 33071]|uniref:Site-specific DNA-methyltransferase (adenine-specific) n=1 Tax=Rahnella aquatilis (strain ATCC 33071 / DSM 4594 / JCM 1683 / NBRC 105701 / NCIMB 13365 / CIP 78.65) TaxID=745277 RepID=H2IY60_RAHAC|nr:Dam family site-specific DNA-(adenine-N6)-methyltransferase [Rahnella aquatilis]AEX53137.1 DNA adenine methylase Dam [Rahnella aquatilis CIP 78.65 = ATCC 33071]KFD04017.1 methyl-directed repair DNA adenine methylase [Rahnella aquatilis CIP 78.65 = ATCC 33071]